MTRRLLIIVVFIFTVHATVLRAEENGKTALGLSLVAGIQPGMAIVKVCVNDEEGEIHPSFAYGFGLSYGGIRLSQTLMLHLSSEVSFIRAETDPSDILSGGTVQTQYRYRGIPVLLWGELHQPGDLGPFIKIGIGAVYSSVDEEHGGLSALDVSIDYWSFAFGFGAGLRYSPTEHVDVLFVTEGFVGTDSGVSENSSGTRVETDSPFGLGTLGVRVRYWF